MKHACLAPTCLCLLPQIYEYQGCQAAQDLLRGQDGETLLTANDQSSLNIRGRLFERFFSLHHVTNVASNGEHLNRECSLFTDDCRYVIVGSAVYVPEEPPPYFFEVTVAAKSGLKLFVRVDVLADEFQSSRPDLLLSTSCRFIGTTNRSLRTPGLH